MKPLQRTNKFPNESLVVPNGKLFCNSCREEVSLKESVIKSHIGSTKHANGKLRIQAKDKHKRDITEALRNYNRECHLVGEILPIEQQTYRIKVFSDVSVSSSAIKQAPVLWDMLEENSF